MKVQQQTQVPSAAASGSVGTTPYTTRPPRESFLPFALPHITEAEIAEVVDTLRSGWISTGPKTKRFEREFAEVIGAQHASAVSSATAGLHLALEAVGVGPGDEVIVPVYTFTSTAAVVVHCGARPVLVDVDPVTFNVDPARIEAAITPRTRAIMVVDFAGLPAEHDAIQAIARAHQLPVIEDAAHAFPATYRERTIGTIADITVFSFYATKALATGDGGMVTTDDPGYAERIGLLALHGMNRDAWKRYTAEGSWYYEVVAPGHKYNMTDVAAAMGLHQLARREWLLDRRAAIAARYTAAFAGLPELQTPPTLPYARHAWHLYPLRLHPQRLSIGRDAFIAQLTAERIGTSVHFIPLHLHPYYRDAFGLAPADFPAALGAYEREISLPIYPGMRDDDADDVIAAVMRTVERHQR